MGQEAVLSYMNPVEGYNNLFVSTAQTPVASRLTSEIPILNGLGNPWQDK